MVVDIFFYFKVKVRFSPQIVFDITTRNVPIIVKDRCFRQKHGKLEISLNLCAKYLSKPINQRLLLTRPSNEDDFFVSVDFLKRQKTLATHCFENISINSDLCEI